MLSPTMLRGCSEDFNGDSNDDAMVTKCRHSMLDEFGDIPQALFELSLRDLVELPQILASAMQEKQSKERDERQKSVRKRRPRSQSMDIGVGLLKWITPLFSSGRKERSVFVSPSSITSRNTSADSNRSVSK